MSIHATTVIALHDPEARCAVVGSDGQATQNTLILKANTRKARAIFDGKVLTGFAGSTADAITLFERFEGKLREYSGNLVRAAVELTKDWRTDRALRRLEALLVVASEDHLLMVSGAGDVMEPDDGVVGLGSGGGYAMAAARALRRETALDLKAIAEKALGIAAELDIYTNDRIHVEELKW